MDRGIHAILQKKDRRGQTLLEAIIAIAIIVTAVSSSLTLVQGAVSAEGESGNSVIAANLAREGIEVVRGMRDGNWLADVAWDVGFEGTGSDYTAAAIFAPGTNTWSLDFTPDEIDAGGAIVYRYPVASGAIAEGLYAQAASAPTDAQPSGFRRLVSLDPICSNGTIVTSGTTCGVLRKVGMRVTVLVTWQGQGGRPHTMSVIEEMYDWR